MTEQQLMTRHQAISNHRNITSHRTPINHKALYRRWLDELWGGYRIAEELVSPDFVGHWPTRDVHGPTELQKVVDNTQKKVAGDGAVDYGDFDKPTVMRKAATRSQEEGGNSEDLEYLDIPAFLRRQAD